MKTIDMKIPKKQYVVKFLSEYGDSYKTKTRQTSKGIEFAKRYTTLEKAKNYVENFAYGESEIIELNMILED